MILSAASTSPVYSPALLGVSGLLIGGAYFRMSKHVLVLLLYLEFASLLGMVFVLLNFSNSYNIVPALMLYFTLAVCEATVGIGVLVKLSRSSGSDKTSSIS